MNPGELEDEATHKLNATRRVCTSTVEKLLSHYDFTYPHYDLLEANYSLRRTM